MLNFIVNYVILDSVSSLIILALLVKNKNRIRWALRSYLQVPSQCDHVCPVRDEHPGNVIDLSDEEENREFH